MKYSISCFILLVFLFGSCRKESTDMNVIYKIKETSTAVPQYNITYTSDKSGSATSIGLSQSDWNSGTIVLTRKEFVSLTLECNASNYDFTLQIIVDGFIWKEAELHNPNSSFTLSGNL